MIPFFGLEREYRVYNKQYDAIYRKVMRSGKLLDGPNVMALEEKVSRLTGRHAVAVASGTDALYFALKAAGISYGSTVLVPDFSFIASASCILRANAAPIFVDVGEDCLMDIDSIKEKGPSAMIYVDIFGLCPNFDKIEKFCADMQICLIEDAAQSFGTSANGRMAGTMGSFGCISFDPTKTVSSPTGGGMVLCKDEIDARKIVDLRYRGVNGCNSQMSELGAALVNFKLDHMEAWIKKRRDIADQILKGETRENISCQKMPVYCENREAIIKRLQSADIQYKIHYPRPLHEELGLAANCPKAKHACEHLVSLPIHPWLTSAEVDQIIEAIE